MKRSKTKYAKCPCCLTDKHRTEMRKCMSILEKIHKKEFKNYKELNLDQYTYGSFIDSNFVWACDNCLESKKAVLANPGLQQTPFTPHLAYFDTIFRCNSCKKEHVFKIEEKKVWYESYKLPIDAQPDKCLDCRRKIRKQNSENKILSEILEKPENDNTINELEKVVDIYITWDKIEKAKYYQSILNKRKLNLKSSNQ